MVSTSLPRSVPSSLVRHLRCLELLGTVHFLKELACLVFFFLLMLNFRVNGRVQAYGNTDCFVHQVNYSGFSYSEATTRLRARRPTDLRSGLVVLFRNEQQVTICGHIGMCPHEIIGVCILIFTYAANSSVPCLELIHVVVSCFYSWLIKLVLSHSCSNSSVSTPLIQVKMITCFRY